MYENGENLHKYGEYRMKLVQFYEPGQESGVGIFQDDQVIDLSEIMPEVETVNDLLYVSGVARLSLSELVERAMNDYDGQMSGFTYESLDVTPDVGVPHLMVPIFSPEVWGFGVTYKRSAEFRDDDARQTIYDQVYQSDRPESFFKATASRCSGPNAPICVRGDSNFTATEPELAYVLGDEGQIVGYTLCNDVSAWDIEKANPLYLNQSKIYQGCCALGPALVTADEIDDPYDIDIHCRILRDDAVVFEGEANTSQLARSFDELNEYLYRDNLIPAGTVVSTGTGIIVPNDLGLREDDIVMIASPQIGVLSNPVQQL